MRLLRLIGRVTTPFGEALIRVGRYPAGGSPCSQEINMVELKFIDGTPVPDDYLQSISLLVRDAALAIDMFGEGELESASRVTAQDASVGGVSNKGCCVCGEEIFEGDERAFGACEACLDKVHREPEAFITQKLLRREYVLRTRAGPDGGVEAAYPTLKEAISAFHAAPVNSKPQLRRIPPHSPLQQPATLAPGITADVDGGGALAGRELEADAGAGAVAELPVFSSCTRPPSKGHRPANSIQRAAWSPTWHRCAADRRGARPCSSSP